MQKNNFLKINGLQECLLLEFHIKCQQESIKHSQKFTGIRILVTDGSQGHIQLMLRDPSPGNEFLQLFGLLPQLTDSFMSKRCCNIYL